MSYFCQNVRYFLEKNRIPVLKFNFDLGLGQNTLRSWERFDRVPKTSTVIKIADYFAVSPDDLLTKDLRRENGDRPVVFTGPRTTFIATAPTDAVSDAISASLARVIDAMSTEDKAQLLQYALSLKIPENE